MDGNIIELYEGCEITIKDKDDVTLKELEELKKLGIDILNLENFGLGISTALYDETKLTTILKIISIDLPAGFEFGKVKMIKFKEAVLSFFGGLGYSFQT